MGQGEVGAEMRAGGAHGRRPWKHAGLCQHRYRDRFAQQGLKGRAQHIGRQFAKARQQVLAARDDAGSAQFGFDQRLGFLNHDQGIDRGGEGAHLFQGQWVTETELKHRRIGKAFAHMHERCAGGDETEAAIGTGQHPVQVAGFGGGAQGLVALVHQGQTRFGIGRRHHPALRIFLKAGCRMLDALAGEADHGLDVADAGGHAYDHRDLMDLGDLEGGLNHFIGFLGISRLQDGHVAKASPVTGILLILRGGQTDVIGDHNHQATDHASQGLGHKRIGCDVHADMLHRCQGARSGQRSANRDFHRDLLIHRPLGIDVRIAGDIFQDLGSGRAGIGGSNPGAGLPGRTRDRLIAREQMTVFDLGVLCWIGHSNKPRGKTDRRYRGVRAKAQR